MHWLIDAMGASLWDKLGLPVLIGIASSALFFVLCLFSVPLKNCLMKLIKSRSAVGVSAHNPPLLDGDAAHDPNGVPDVEMGNDCGPPEGRHSMAESELELGIMNSGEGIEHFSDLHTPVFESPLTTPEAQVTGVAATGALMRRVEMDVPHSQQEEKAAE